MDVYEAVTSRRAVRRFIDREVPKEMLERVLSAAAWSPSASNLQPWHTLGISRDDWDARRRAATENWDCFGAPAALFCYIDRDMGQPQWSDAGMYLQTVTFIDDEIQQHQP
jgi:nitroreductase